MHEASYMQKAFFCKQKQLAANFRLFLYLNEYLKAPKCFKGDSKSRQLYLKPKKLDFQALP